MTRRSWIAPCAIAIVASTSVAGCQLKRPETVPGRMIEPQLTGEQAPQETDAPAIELRLLETQARAHIGRRLLHHLPSGELIEDPVWRWSSTPYRYLDTALRLEFAANKGFRLVDSAAAPLVAVTLVAWQIEGEDNTRLLAAIEVQYTGADRVVRMHLVRDSEPVSGELPGDLSVAAGRLLGRLASEASKRIRLGNS